MGHQSPRVHAARGLLLSAFATLALVACNTPGGGPTAPTTNTPPRVGLSLNCPSSLLTGERSPCSAAAQSANGQTVSPWGAGVWSAIPPGVVEVDDFGYVTGRTVGAATVSATYQGMTASAPIVVRHEDGVRVAGGLSQGGPTQSTTGWFGLGGYYSVVTADSGELRLEARNQAGIVIGANQQTVARGGRAFSVDLTYSVPVGTTQVCAFVVLDVGGLNIEAQYQTSAQRVCALR